MKNRPSRLVYSTESGRHCPQCLRAMTDCVCGKDRPAALGDGVVRLRRETKGRGGKAVTTISGIPLSGARSLSDLTVRSEGKQRLVSFHSRLRRIVVLCNESECENWLIYAFPQ